MDRTVQVDRPDQVFRQLRNAAAVLELGGKIAVSHADGDDDFTAGPGLKIVGERLQRFVAGAVVQPERRPQMSEQRIEHDFGVLVAAGHVTA